MLISERHDRILQRLEQEGTVYVSELSRSFDVSEETIRRDLERLENEGFAKRCYGGASFTGGTDLPVKVRKKSNVAGKRRIAEAVAERIPDGACVALDDSSTAIFAAEFLKSKNELTIITHSIEIALMLSDKTDWTILLTGGTLRATHLAMVGTKAVDFIKNYSIGYTLISCAGMDMDRGIFDPVEENARVKEAMINVSEHIILMADRQKFGRRSLTLISPLSGIDEVVTDFDPDAEWKASLEKKNVKLTSII